MNPLAAWMSRTGESDASLAKKLSLSRVQVSRLRRGKYLPSVATAKKLEAITEIPWPEFVDREQPLSETHSASAGQP